VLTVDGGGYALVDEGLVAETEGIMTLQASGFEPQKWLFPKKKNASQVQQSKESGAGSLRKKLKPLLNYCLQFVRLNFFIPDSRIGWIKPAIRRGKQSDIDTPDIIMSSAPPYSVHFVAKALARYYQCPWVADFRDPWLENLTYNVTPRFPWVKALTSKMERTILESASAVTCTGWRLRDLYASKIAPKHSKKFSVITNGYDLEEISYQAVPLKTFTITYVGTLYSQGLSDSFFRVIQAMLSDPQFKQDFVLRLVGTVDPNAMKLVNQYIPPENLDVVGFVESGRISSFLKQEQLLLLFIYNVPFNECITLGKVFDYLQTNNPILSVGPDGDTATILNQHGEEVISCIDTNQIRGKVEQAYADWQSGSFHVGRTVQRAFTRSSQAQQFNLLFEELIGSNS